MYKIIFGQVAVALLIASLAFLLSFYARGYRFDYKHMKVIKTGVIYASAKPVPDQIVLNGRPHDGKKTFSKGVPAGDYSLQLKKDQYHTWSRTFRVDPEVLVEFPDIVLFKKDAARKVLSDESKIQYLNSPSEVLAENSEKDLTYNDYEIWLGDELVTRFSTPIKRVAWYPDLKHILYQQENQIRIIEISGTYDLELASLEGDGITRFAIGKRGTELYYTDQEKYYVVEIR